MTTKGELIGSRLDALGLRADIGPDQQIMQVLVILKVVDITDDDGDPHLVIAADESTDWIAERGLLHCAREIFEQVDAERSGD